MNTRQDQTITPGRDPVLILVGECIRELLPGQGGRPESMALPGAKLGADLGLGSLELVRLIGLLRKKLARTDIPFHQLFLRANGGIVADMTVAEVADFVRTQSGANGAGVRLA